MLQTLVISMDSVFLLIDIFILRIILLLMPKEGLIVKKIIKFFKLLNRRIEFYNAEAELKFILENNLLSMIFYFFCIILLRDFSDINRFSIFAH